MSNVLVNETSLQNIASAIRTKNGSSDTYTPSEMASGISSIKYKPKYISFCIVNRPDPNPIENLDNEVENLDTSLITSMKRMFANCTKIKKLNLSNWNTSNVINMQAICSGCSNLQKVDASGFTAKSGTIIDSMFSNCTILNLVDMRNFDFTIVQLALNAFTRTPTTCEIVVADSTQKEWFATNYSDLTGVMTAAEYDAKCHIHLEYGDGSSISKKYYYSIAVGDTTTLPDSTDITPPTGKVFDHWEDSEGNTVTSYTATSSDINKTIEFTAIYVDSE